MHAIIALVFLGLSSHALAVTGRMMVPDSQSMLQLEDVKWEDCALSFRLQGRAHAMTGKCTSRSVYLSGAGDSAYCLRTDASLSCAAQLAGRDAVLIVTP